MCVMSSGNCHRCGEPGHLARECSNAPVDNERKPVTYVPEPEDSVDELYTKGEFHACNVSID